MLTLWALWWACTGSTSPETAEHSSSDEATESEHSHTGEDTAQPILVCPEGVLHCASVEGAMEHHTFSLLVDDEDARLEVVEVSCDAGFTLLLDGEEPRVWVALAVIEQGALALGEDADEVAWSQRGGAYTQFGTTAYIDAVDFTEVHGTGQGRLQRAEAGQGGIVAGWLQIEQAWLKDHTGVRLSEDLLTGEVLLRFSAQCP